MAEACPKMYSCSANSSGWLDGTHPTVAEGIVQRKVCFSQRVSQFFNDCCNQAKTISVRNCGAFYVYRLDPSDHHSRYCGNGLSQAPGKNELLTFSILPSRMTLTREVSKNSNAFAEENELNSGVTWSVTCFRPAERGFRTGLKYCCFWFNNIHTKIVHSDCRYRA